MPCISRSRNGRLLQEAYDHPLDAAARAEELEILGYRTRVQRTSTQVTVLSAWPPVPTRQGTGVVVREAVQERLELGLGATSQ